MPKNAVKRPHPDAAWWQLSTRPPEPRSPACSEARTALSNRSLVRVRATPVDQSVERPWRPERRTTRSFRAAPLTSLPRAGRSETTRAPRRLRCAGISSAWVIAPIAEGAVRALRHLSQTLSLENPGLSGARGRTPLNTHHYRITTYSLPTWEEEVGVGCKKRRNPAGSGVSRNGGA